jgi:hypothetical protein
LDRCETHNLFVCDELQQGRRNHSVLVGDDRHSCQFVATAFTESLFHLWRRLPDAEPEVKVDRVLEEQLELDLTPEERKKGWVVLPTQRFQKQVVKPSFEVYQSLIIPLPRTDPYDVTEWAARNRWKNRYDHWAKIKGELWAVPRSRFRAIDEWMLNGKLFQRQRVRLEIPLRTIETYGNNTQITRSIEEQEAFMYVGIPEFWEPQIDGGFNFQPVKIYSRPDLSRQYYTYTFEEDLE